RKALLDPRLVDPEILQKAGVLGQINYQSSAKYNKLEALLTDKEGPVQRGEKFIIFSSMFREGVTQQEHQDLKEKYRQMGISHLYDSLQLSKSLDVLLAEGFQRRGFKANIGVIDGT